MPNDEIIDSPAGEQDEYVYSLPTRVCFSLTSRDAAALAFLAHCTFEAGGTPTPILLIQGALESRARALGWTPPHE